MGHARRDAAARRFTSINGKNSDYREYAPFDLPLTTNTIEGFWSLVKRGLSGVYHSVGSGYLQTYLTATLPAPKIGPRRSQHRDRIVD